MDKQVNAKLKQLVGSFDKNGIDALLVIQDINIRYLTDFPASESWLLVTPQKAIYITDFRYVLEAKKELDELNLRGHPNSQD